jgi:hypothetical protein
MNEVVKEEEKVPFHNLQRPGPAVLELEAPASNLHKSEGTSLSNVKQIGAIAERSLSLDNFNPGRS